MIEFTLDVSDRETLEILEALPDANIQQRRHATGEILVLITVATPIVVATIKTIGDVVKAGRAKTKKIEFKSKERSIVLTGYELDEALALIAEAEAKAP